MVQGGCGEGEGEGEGGSSMRSSPTMLRLGLATACAPRLWCTVRRLQIAQMVQCRVVYGM